MRGWISDEEQSHGAFSLFSGREANRTGGLGVTPLPHDSRRRLFQTNAVAAARTDNRRVNAALPPSVCVWALGGRAVHDREMRISYGKIPPGKGGRKEGGGN